MKANSSDIIEYTILYNKYKKNLYNYAVKMLNDKMLAEDIVQNVFLKLYERFNEIRNRNSIIYWLFTTARNEIFTVYRSKKSHVDKYNVEDSDEIEIISNESLENLFEEKELKDLIMKELSKMAPEQSEAYILKEFSQLSYKEIAIIMNIDENLVKSRLFKTRQKLIKILSKILTE